MVSTVPQHLAAETNEMKLYNFNRSTIQKALPAPCSIVTQKNQLFHLHFDISMNSAPGSVVTSCYICATLCLMTPKAWHPIIV